MERVSPQLIIEGLMRRGYPAHVAQGFVMNMMDESGLRPGINEAAPIVPGSRGGFGLYQLTGPRRTAYEQFAAQRGVDPASAEAQLDFLDYELKGPESRAAKSILSTSNPQEAAVAIARDFLRPASEHLQNRVARYSGADVAADTMAALGKGGGAVTPDQIAQSAQAQSTGMQEEKPKGLMGLFGNPDLMANLAIAFNSMRLNPDPNLPAVLSAQMKERRKGREEAAKLNKTLAYFEKLASGGDTRAAEALAYAKGTGDITGALKMATSKADGTAAMQNYAEYNRIFKELGPEAASKFLEMTGGQKTVVSIQDKGETKMAETFGKGIAEQALQALEVGGQAQRNLGRYQLLGEILANAPQGGKGAFVAAASNLGIKLEGASDAEAAQAIINQLVPEQRQPGSGPMSDADLALFKQSLPRLVNTPEGNRLILETLNAISQYDIQRAMIAQELASGSIDTPEYLKKLNSLPNPLEMFRQAGGAAAPTMSREDALKILMSE